MNQPQKPIVPTEDMTLYQRQRCGQRFKDQAIKGLNPLIKGTGWKRNSAWVFKVETDWYLTAFVSGGTTRDGMANLLRVEMGIKPMAVDPIHWRASGLHDNLKKPPSFRSNAAWKVPALPIAKFEQADGLVDVAEASRILFDAIARMADTARDAVAATPFSQLVAEHENADRYGALRWASLIAEGRGALAIEEIRAHYGIDEESDLPEALAGYQDVVDGTDAPSQRRLVSDINGNPKTGGPAVAPVQDPAPPAHSKPGQSKPARSLIDRLVSRLAPRRK